MTTSVGPLAGIGYNVRVRRIGGKWWIEEIQRTWVA
jgi:hypothetical protein